MSIVPINQGEGNNNGSNTNSSSMDDLWDPNAMAALSAMDLWDPINFRDFPLPLPFPPSISSLFSDFGFGSSVNTRVDWRETPRAHVWKVVLPGFSNEDVLVELQEERVLQVSVESGNFMSRFKIPENGNLQQLKANMNHGVLIVTVPKYEIEQQHTRVIEIDDGSG